MGICETKKNTTVTTSLPPVRTINTEAMNVNSPMIPLEPIKSICKIVLDSPKKIASGFLIKLFKDEQPFYCLMTNEHVDIIKRRQAITFYYDNQNRIRNIDLNPEERFIKDFRDIKMDATIIEIIPKDEIPQDYFLLPLIDYMDNFDKLIGKNIIIIQYPDGKLNLTDGKIEYLTEATNYEFVHGASTDEGSSGSPIFLKGSTKVVGIHKGYIKTKQKKENCGDFNWPIFSYFKNFKNNSNNKSNNIIKEKSELNNNKINFANNLNEINKVNKNDGEQISGLIQDNSNKGKLNQITIVYRIKSNDNSVKLFGSSFVKNNIDNCYLLIKYLFIKNISFSL